MRVFSLPVVVLATVAGMLALDRFLPLVQVVAPEYTVAGIPVLLGGSVLVVRARREMERHRLPYAYGAAPGVLVTTGPFRYSRHPGYLGGLLLCLGVALLLGSLMALLVVFTAFVIYNAVIVPPEERGIREALGGAYSDYERNVRRWL